MLIINCPSIPFCSYPQELSPTANSQDSSLFSPQHLNCPPCCEALARVSCDRSITSFFPNTPGDSCLNSHPTRGLNPTDFTTEPRQPMEMEPLCPLTLQVNGVTQERDQTREPQKVTKKVRGLESQLLLLLQSKRRSQRQSNLRKLLRSRWRPSSRPEGVHPSWRLLGGDPKARAKAASQPSGLCRTRPAARAAVGGSSVPRSGARPPPAGRVKSQ